MSINDPLFSLDIVGISNDVTSTNCMLKKNQTTMISRGTVDDVVAIRDEILFNRGYRVPEFWDHSWIRALGPTWTPDSLSANLETWLSPEYFRPETNNPTLCIEATNRVDDTLSFQQTVVGSMPALTEGSSFKNFNGLVFDGVNDHMRGMDTDMWNVAGDDFMLAVVVDTSGVNKTVPIASKKGALQFSLEVDYSVGNEDVQFYMNNILLEHAGVSSGKQIIVCGREAGVAFIYVNGQFRSAASSDTTNLSQSHLPWLGDKDLNADEYSGAIYEVIFINDTLSGSSVVDQDLKETLAGYLAWKYGMTDVLEASHPYKTTPPRASVV